LMLEKKKNENKSAKLKKLILQIHFFHSGFVEVFFSELKTTLKTHSKPDYSHRLSGLCFHSYTSNS
jgi:hypothetical protein